MPPPANRLFTNAALGGEVALIVSDVLQGNLEGSDQDPVVISARNATISAIIRDYGATEIAITHSPWHDAKRARGHTHLWGNADTRLKAEGDPEELQATLSVDRHKDADSGMTWKFQMEKIQLNEETSTLAPVLMEEGIGIGREKKGTQKDYGLRLLERAIGEAGESIPGEHSTLGVKTSLWRHYCESYNLALPSTKSDSQGRAFRRTLSDLQTSGKIITRGEMVWIPKG